jgi:hypothetical protein
VRIDFASEAPDALLDGLRGARSFGQPLQSFCDGRHTLGSRSQRSLWLPPNRLRGHVSEEDLAPIGGAVYGSPQLLQQKR